ncbi:MAG: SRPBCC family protein [Pseudomonadota bacterium]|nr:SRPBCC family protein [Pseudomonadota bacterium]
MLAVLKWLFYLIAAIALIVVVGSFFLPAQAMVSRSTDIAAPPEKIFAIVGDLRRFNEFSPWAELDPGTKYTFEGPVSGIGQQMNWTSQNTDIGSGSQTIVAHEPPNFVETQLDFGTRGKSVARFDLVPSTSGTNVTWTFSSDLDGIPAKWFGLTLDRRIGADYEKGLFKLKTIAEAPVQPTPEPSTSETTAPATPEQIAPEQPMQPSPEPTTPGQVAPEQPATPEPTVPEQTQPPDTVAPEQPAQ